MKAITVHVDETIYEAFQRVAKLRGRKTAELIRVAMRAYWQQHIERQASLSDIQPVSVGAILAPLNYHDLLDEMSSYDAD